MAYIVWRYKNQQLTEVNTQGYIDWKNNQMVTDDNWKTKLEWYHSLQEGKITIEEYLEGLNDFELIVSFQSQCCLEYR